MKYLVLGVLFALSSCMDANPKTLESGVTFEEVLAEYEALNARLETIAYRLQSTNVDLCPRTTNDTGILVHLISDYPESIQPVAQILLGASDRLSIRKIRAGSSADQAGLKAKDQILRLGENWLPSGPTVKTLYESYVAQNENTHRLSFKRNTENFDVSIIPEKICGYPVNVFFSENINGHTDGKEVWVTSELMRTVPDDVNLALVVAHEMAHAIADHIKLSPTKNLELQADRMALIMMERAGFDIERAIGYWQHAPHPHGAGNPNSQTHPTMGERLNNFRRSLNDIRNAQKSGRPLNFEI